MSTIDQASKAVIKIFGSLATLVKFATLENASNNVASNAFSSVYVAIRNTLGA